MGIPEDSARQLLVSQGVERPPVAVDVLAESLGVRLHYAPFGGDISGMLVRREDGAHIAINSAQARTRQRFTIAHELGHLRLHKGKPVIIEKALRPSGRVNLRGATASMGTDREEREANAFAAQLLMPEEFVRAALLSYVGDQDTVSDRALVEHLAERFEVSAQAIEFRLVNLKLLAPFGMA